jgi:hypothetical protein
MEGSVLGEGSGILVLKSRFGELSRDAPRLAKYAMHSCLREPKFAQHKPSSTKSLSEPCLLTFLVRGFISIAIIMSAVTV